jgi:mannose-1-phosphate guanylyltransferase/mannose-6-phosphate isomerase
MAAIVRTPCWYRARRGANGLKRLVAKLKTVAPEVTENHLKVHWPWGSYQSVDDGDRHQVKRIVVKPGGRLSLQKHHHRSEQWIVVRGAARVTVNELVKTVHENESIYIPIGAVHRLENPGKILLELIEVQTGSYLGEDDIIRIEDDYQRSWANGTNRLIRWVFGEPFVAQDVFRDCVTF